MRWSSVLTYLSALVLVAAVIGRVAGWLGAGVEWLLLGWAVLLVPVALVLFRHPMRSPAWGLFLGFWGFLAALTLIVLQALAVADVLRDPSRTFAEAWPLGVFGLWVAVTSILGRPERTETDLPAPVTWLGALAGAALLASAVVGALEAQGAVRPAFFAAAVAYVLWSSALSGEIWNWVAGRPGSTRPEPGRAGQAAARPEPAAAPATPGAAIP